MQLLSAHGDNAVQLCPWFNRTFSPMWRSGGLPKRGVLSAMLVSLALMSGSLWLISPKIGWGQTNPVPNVNYYAAFGSYYQADYRDALRDFNSGANTSIRFGTDRFLDWTCYTTMAAECHFHLGNWASAVNGYEQALALYGEFQDRNWQTRVQQPPLVNIRNGAVQAAQISWGVPQRAIQIAGLPDSFTVLFGDPEIERRIREGGAVLPPELRPVDVGEIMRCAAISLHRRRSIKGVTCKFDPFTSQIHAKLTRTVVNDGSVLGAWNGVLAGISHASLEEFDQAERILSAALQFGGGMDHPLTPIALLELATIHHQRGNQAQAGQLAMEASYSAAIYRQYDIVEESLALAATIHLLRDKSPMPALEPAIAWSARQRARLPQISLGIRLAECLSEAGESALSARVLGDTLRLASRSQLSKSPLVGRGLYVSAVNLFLEGRFDLGLAELNKGLVAYAPGSRWLYQLGLTDSLFVAGGIGERTAELLYERLLRDPSAEDWQMDPLEAIAFLASPHLDPMARWFEIVLARRDYDRAIEIAELLRRHRFFSAFACGGREIAFRWMMHAPVEALPSSAEQQRQNLLGRYPEYRQLTDRAERLRLQAQALPLNPVAGSDERKQQIALLAELMDVSKSQEAFLASLALRREPAQMVFPPQVASTELRSSMRDQQLVLYCVQTAKATYFIGMTARGARLISWHRPPAIQSMIQKALKDSGLADRQLDVAALNDEKWKRPGWDLAQAWFPEIDWGGFSELPEIIVIPDGPVWYVPFEILRVGESFEESQMLVERAVIRYSPTLSLALKEQRPTSRRSRLGVFTGPLESRWDMANTEPFVQQLEQRSPDVARFEGRSDIPSNLLASVMDAAVVWSAVDRPTQGGAFGLFPLQLDKGRPDSQLGAWMTLPWRGIDHFVLPGFHADAAQGLKPNCTGDELFFTSCGLLAAGCRTVVISRWAIPGKSTLELTSEYFTQLDQQASAGEAWRAAVLEFQTRPLTLNQESRVKAIRDPPETLGTHPLFWSGYLVFDVPAKASSELTTSPDDGVGN
ncbi:MAG TPA: CHAT domain-containing protein [Pirellulaceae bacterium]|nr:CHAT domain-containing protein [Pirellulaceae bacterium]